MVLIFLAGVAPQQECATQLPHGGQRIRSDWTDASRMDKEYIPLRLLNQMQCCESFQALTPADGKKVLHDSLLRRRDPINGSLMHADGFCELPRKARRAALI